MNVTLLATLVLRYGDGGFCEVFLARVIIFALQNL